MDNDSVIILVSNHVLLIMGFSDYHNLQTGNRHEKASLIRLDESMEYQSLRKLYHMDASPDREQHAEKLAMMRLEADSTFRTGMVTPHGELFLAVPRELSVINERVLRFERSIASKMRALPTVALGAMTRDLVVNEVVSTNELEGVYSTRRQISELLEAGRRDGDPLGKKRFRELATLYLGLTDFDQARPSSPEDIRAIYNRVMSGEPLEEQDRPDGKLFRRGQVEIIGQGSKVIHEGLYPEKAIIDAIEKMLSITESADIPQTYSAIISHYIFEYTHPFYDGNGRTGRYLLALYLRSPLSMMTSLSLSRVIAENRAGYYRSFREAEHPLNRGELTFFVMNMLENVRIAQDELDRVLEEKRSKLDEVNDTLESFGRSNRLSDKELNIVYMLAQLDLFATFPEATQDAIASHIGLSKQQSRVYTKSLEEKKLIDRVSTRPLRFCLSSRSRSGLGF